MGIDPLPIVGIAFLALALWRAVRVRHDLAASETRWDRAIFGRGDSISRAKAPVKFWCVIALNTVIVCLFGLVAAVAFRLISLAALRP